MKIQFNLSIYGLLLLLSQSVIAQTWDIDITSPGIKDPILYRATTKEFDLLQINYLENRVPAQNIPRGGALRWRIILPPGISYASISGESGQWQGPSIGTFPIMTTLDTEPPAPCFPRVTDINPNCNPSDLTVASLTPTTAALNRILYGNATPNFPVRTVESSVYFILYHPVKASLAFNFKNIRITMLVKDRALYENWRTNGSTTIPPTTGTDTGNTDTGEGINLPPVINAPLATQQVQTGTNLLFSGASNNQITLSDPDASSNKNLELTLTSQGGTLTLTNLNNLEMLLGDGAGDTVITTQGTIDELNTALNGLSYTPFNNFTGPGLISIKINDKGNTGTGGEKQSFSSIAISVNAGVVITEPTDQTPIIPPVSIDPDSNKAPINRLPIVEQTVVSGEVLIFSSGLGNQIAVSDPDAADNEIQLTLIAENSSISLARASGLSFSQGDGSKDGTMVFRGKTIDINLALNGLRFVPNPNFLGNARLIFELNDLGNTGTGDAQIDKDVIVIAVTSPNTAPTDDTLPPTSVEPPAEVIAGDLPVSVPNDPVSLPVSNTRFFSLPAFAVNNTGEVNSQIGVDIQTAVRLHPLDGFGDSMSDANITLNDSDQVLLEARIQVHTDHQNAQAFAVVLWANVEAAEMNNQHWLQRNGDLQFFGAQSWADWNGPQTLPVTDFQHFGALNLDKPFMISAGRLQAPATLTANNRTAFIFIGYNADDTISGQKAQVFAGPITFHLQN